MTADTVSSRLLRLDTPSGIFNTIADDLIGRQLQDFGAHTRNELAMVLDHVADGETFVDIGAHIGTFAIPIARKLGRFGKLLAVESSPETFDLLERNIGANGLAHRIQTCCAIVGSGSHQSLRRVEVSGNTGAGFYVADAAGGSRSVNPRMLLCEYGFARFDFMKIDIEGMEWFVLKALVPMITLRRPKLYIEVVAEQLARFNIGVADLERLLRDLGYRFYRNIGERNSMNDKYIKTELRSLADGGDFFDLLALPS